MGRKRSLPRWLRGGSLIAIALIATLALAACGGTETVTVEKEVVVEVEKIVEVVVEKEVIKEVEVEVTAVPKVVKLGFSNLLRTGCDFCMSVEDGVKEVFEALGMEVFAVDGNLDGNQMIANADAMVTRGVDIFLDFDGGITNYVATIEKMKDAGIPVLFIDGLVPEPAPGVWWFGADADLGGRQMGEYAVKYANDNWDGQIDGIFAVWVPGWTDDTKQRLTSGMKAINAAFPEWSMDTITISGAVLEAEPTQAAATAYLNANPGSKKLLFLTTTSDNAAIAVIAAMDSLNRLDAGVILSHGADQEAIPEIRDASSPFIMSIGYFPERYGEMMRPLVEKILAGLPVDPVTNIAHVPVDITNVGHFYPEN